jgi:hypothetical protein
MAVFHGFLKVGDAIKVGEAEGTGNDGRITTVAAMMTPLKL